MAQRIVFPVLPKVDPALYLDKLNRLLFFVDDQRPNLRELREFMQEEEMWDRELLDDDFWEFYGIQKGKRFKLIKLGSRLLDSRTDQDGEREILFRHMLRENEILAKYVFEALAERLHSDAELYRYITSYVYPGVKPRRPDFLSWLKLMSVTGYIRIIGIRWALSETGQEAMRLIEQIDVESLLEEERLEEEGDDEDDEDEEEELERAIRDGRRKRRSDEDDGEEADGEEGEDARDGQETVAAEDEGEEEREAPAASQVSSGSLPPAAPAELAAAAPAAAPAGAARQPDLPDMPPAPPRPAARQGLPVPEGNGSSAAAAGGAVGLGGGAAAVAPAGQPGVALPPLPVVLEASPASFVVPAELRQPARSMQTRTVPRPFGPAQVAENIERLRAWWEEYEHRQLRQATDFALGALEYELEPAPFLLKVLTLSTLVIGDERGADRWSFFNRLNRVRFFSRLMADGAELYGLLAELEFFAEDPSHRMLGENLLTILRHRERLAAEPELPQRLTALDDGASLIDTLDELFFDGRPSLEAYWVVREMVLLGLWKHPALRGVAAVPHKAVRRAAFRLGVLDTPYASTGAELLEAARRISAASAGELDLDEPLFHLQHQLGCKSGCPHAASCDYSCRECFDL